MSDTARLQRLRERYRDERSNLMLPLRFAGSYHELMLADRTTPIRVPADRLDLRNFHERDRNRQVEQHHTLWLLLTSAPLTDNHDNHDHEGNNNNNNSIHTDTIDPIERDHLLRHFERELDDWRGTGGGARESNELAQKLHAQLNYVSRLLATRLLSTAASPATGNVAGDIGGGGSGSNNGEGGGGNGGDVIGVRVNNGVDDGRFGEAGEAARRGVGGDELDDDGESIRNRGR